MKGTFILLAIIFIYGASYSQEVVLKGKILNKETQSPLYMVNIRLLDDSGSFYTTSNRSGEFAINYDTIQNSTILFSHVGYANYEYKPKLSDIINKDYRIVIEPELCNRNIYYIL